MSNYCVWDPAKEPLCGNPDAPDYCHPKQYQGLPNSLFHNNGDGTFTDVSAPSGIRAHVGKGMGIGSPTSTRRVGRSVRVQRHAAVASSS